MIVGAIRPDIITLGTKRFCGIGTTSCINEQRQAVFAANDVSALEALHCAKEIKIQVPGNPKFVGYSNDTLSSIIIPSMNVIEQFFTHTRKLIVTEPLKMLKKDFQLNSAADFPQISTAVVLIRRMSTYPFLVLFTLPGRIGCTLLHEQCRIAASYCAA
ncbi:MAG: substrate-binding domain-containing protein [Bacteroidota bacterium]